MPIFRDVTYFNPFIGASRHLRACSPVTIITLICYLRRLTLKEPRNMLLFYELMIEKSDNNQQYSRQDPDPGHLVDNPI